MAEDFLLDWAREQRTAASEAVFCAGKTAHQIAAIVTSAAGRRLLLTHLSAATLAALPGDVARALDYHALSATAWMGPPLPLSPPRVCIVAAGTSDMGVAWEAARTLAFHGQDAEMVADVGVAGLWRLVRRLDDIRRHDVIIAVAGMEGALFSVLGGLVDAPIIAVPSSVGYGVSAGGQAALSSALASCAPGMVCVNIDNGFGAACAALRLLRRLG